MNISYPYGLLRTARLLKASGILTSLLLAATLPAAVFTLDDGSPETFGGTSGGDCLSLNHFNTGGQTVFINQISVCWNPLSSVVSPKVALYSDPNGDGNPSDARLLQLYSLSIQPGLVILNNTTVQNYSIPVTPVTGSFFVGAYLSDAEPNFDPVVGIDTSSPHPNQSWFIENSRGPGLLDLNNPYATGTLSSRLDAYVAGSFLIEAQYTVPEPSTACLLALGGVGLALLRQKRAPGRTQPYSARQTGRLSASLSIPPP